MDTLTARTATTIKTNLNLFLVDQRVGQKCRKDVETLIKFIECTPYSTKSRSEVVDYWRSMKDMCNFIEIEGVDSPFYGLKSQLEKVMRYF